MKFPFDLADETRREVRDVDGLAGLFFDAAATELKLPRAYDLRAKGCWPDFASDPDLAYGYNEAQTKRSAATPKEMTRYDLALRVSQYFDADDAKLVWAASHSAARRARGPRWKAISKILGVHPATAKRRYERAILGLWYKM